MIASSRVFSLFLLLSAFSLPAFAQSYKTAAGIRVDHGVNLTIQQYITNGWTAEGILHTSLGSEDLGVSLLAEKHHKIIFRGLNFYTGAGAHYYGVSDATREANTTAKNVFGLSAIGGAELSLGRLNFSVDWKPELHLTGDTVHPFDWNGASISARYIFAKREKKKVKDWKVWDKLGGKKETKKKESKKWF